MIQNVQQLHLSQRIPALVQMIDAARARKAQDQKDEDYHMDLLAQAEAELAGDPPAFAGIEKSGYIEHNPYTEPTAAQPAPAVQGDLQPPH